MEDKYGTGGGVGSSKQCGLTRDTYYMDKYMVMYIAYIMTTL